MADSRSSTSYPQPSYPGTTLHYSRLHEAAADRAAALGLDRAVVFAALASRWAELEGLAVMSDEDFKAALS